MMCVYDMTHMRVVSCTDAEKLVCDILFKQYQWTALKLHDVQEFVP